jgi:hypothetical protein
MMANEVIHKLHPDVRTHCYCHVPHN